MNTGPSSDDAGADPRRANVSSDRDPVEVLAAEFLTRYRRGESPTIEQYAEAHPELAEPIRRLFPTIAAMERLKAQREQSADGRASLGPDRLERLGDFRILREIGRGGMGIVFEAEQQSLGRRVAVKVLPRQSLVDPKQLRRFQREAQTAAKLHHTNIVQVFGVGEQDGFHYYVMQYIEGVGLDRVLARPAQTGPGQGRAADKAVEATRNKAGESRQSDPPPDRPFERRNLQSPGPLGTWRRVAEIGVQVASALQYAHAHGTLHRDIKPSNLLLDAESVVWVTDFGLAKAMQQDGASQSGELAGTLRYMAPERFQGEADARSDVYSLGLTLYELLTGQPAYDDSNPSRLIRRITTTEPTRPRKLNARIPRDLETIVLKAIALEPARRYQSAGGRQADLERLLDHRPIRARRMTLVERAWRWSRKNKALAGLAAAALGLLMLVAIVATAGYVRTRRANQEVTRALQRESAQHMRAEATSELALEALDRIFQRFVPGRGVPDLEQAAAGPSGPSDQTPVQPVLSKEAAALLESMLGFYDRLAQQGGDDARLRQKAAEALRRVGDIHQRLGDCARAEAAYQQSLRLYERLVEDFPEVAEYRYDLSETYAMVDVRPSRLAEAAYPSAERRLRSALETAEKLVAEHPHVPHYAALPVQIHLKLGDLLRLMGRLDDAETSYRQAVHLQTALADRFPEVVAYQLRRAAAQRALAQLLTDRGQLDQSRLMLESAIGDLEQLLEGHPDLSPVHEALSEAYTSLAQTLRQMGRADSAVDASRQAVEHRRLLRASAPRASPTRPAEVGAPAETSVRARPTDPRRTDP